MCVCVPVCMHVCACVCVCACSCACMTEIDAVYVSVCVCRTLFVLCTYLNGQEERSRIMRRSVARYMMFGLIVIMRSVSVAVMKRFPTIDTIVEAGRWFPTLKMLTS